MREGIAMILRPLEGATLAMGHAVRAGDHATALRFCREVMSGASKLYQRLTVLAELEADGAFLADALGEAPHPATPSVKPIPGDQPLPFDETPEAPKARRAATKRPAKGRG